MQLNFTHLWDNICDFCWWEFEEAFNEEIGTGNIELIEVFMGEDNPDLATDVGIPVTEKEWELELWGGGIRG